MVYRKNFDIVIYQGDKVDESQGCFILWFLCVLCEYVWCGISGHALNAKASKFPGTKMCICLQGTPYSESLKFPGTKWGVRLR